MTTLADRLRLAMTEAKMNQKELADAVGVKPPSVNGWLSEKAKFLRGENLLKAASALGVSDTWLATGHGSMRADTVRPTRYRLSESDGDDGALPIQLSNTRGSCGGGAIHWDEDQREPLLKEPAWFRKYKLKPKDALAVWADGESMADFIVDGDIVIFNVSKTVPYSGRIYLIEHPDGLRIKRLRREIDGAWVLENNNQDKRRFPDERIAPEHLELLSIRGEFVYRQGG